MFCAFAIWEIETESTNLNQGFKTSTNVHLLDGSPEILRLKRPPIGCWLDSLGEYFGVRQIALISELGDSTLSYRVTLTWAPAPSAHTREGYPCTTEHLTLPETKKPGRSS